LKYIEVIVPLPLPGTFTYSIAEELYIDVGFRVIVPFGQSKYYTGIIYKIYDDNQKDFNVKEILDVIDDSPIITKKQLNFIEWISKYYMCSLGEAYNAALPSALKLKSESTITIHPDVDLDNHILDERETTLLNWLQQKDLTFKEASEILELKYPQKIIKNLNQRGLITVFEKVKDRYTSNQRR
jgi:primosomal protein N' (replication factor Y)